MKLQPAPTFKVVVTHSGTDYTHENETFTTIAVTRVENGVDVATLVGDDYQGKNWPDKMDAGDTIKIYEKDRNDASWISLFNGVIDTVEPILSMKGDMLNLECSGTAYGFKQTACGEEYGAQSSHSSLDTIAEILTNASYGVVPKWVNKILGGATDSGYNYDYSNVAIIGGSINYAYFPFKPNNKCVDDLCDLVTAIKAGSAGPHWIVDTDNKFRLKRIGFTQTGWTKYYGDSQENATLEQGKHFLNAHFEKLKSEANFILYHGATVKPLSLDAWTESAASSWGSNAYANVTDDSGAKQVGANSIKITSTNTGGALKTIQGYYPSSLDLGLNLTNISGDFNIPISHSWLQSWASGGAAFRLTFNTDASNYYIVGGNVDDNWTEITVPIGPKAAKEPKQPSWFYGYGQQGSPDWSNINGIGLVFYTDADDRSMWIDNFYMKAYVLRAAKNSTKITNEKLRLKVITDDVAKHDSWKASDHSGTIARLAYQELLRGQTTPIVGAFQIPILPDLLPGQYLHIHARKKKDGTFQIDKDMRVTSLTHTISEQGFLTVVEVTDDLTNSHPRARFEDLSKVMKDVRPEFQDRQASSIKARTIDITQTILEKDYPS